MADQTIDGSTAGRVLAAMRPVRVLQCAMCGKEIAGRGRKRYCGNTCTVKAYRRRKSDRRKAQRQAPS